MMVHGLQLLIQLPTLPQCVAHRVTLSARQGLSDDVIRANLAQGCFYRRCVLFHKKCHCIQLVTAKQDIVRACNELEVASPAAIVSPCDQGSGPDTALYITSFASAMRPPDTHHAEKDG